MRRSPGAAFSFVFLNRKRMDNSASDFTLPPRPIIGRAKQTKKTMKKTRTVLSIGALALLAAGCVSQPLVLPTAADTSKGYTVVGQGEGHATGLMLFDIIPIGQNERFVKAYDAAVKSQNGDALIDVTIQENWFWGYVLDGYSTKVTGTVIKYNK